MRHLAHALLVIAVAGCGPASSDTLDERPGVTAEAVKQCARGPTVRGVDVSYHQGRVDWRAAHAGGVAFAFVRVSDGSTFVDPELAANWKGTKAAGVVRGAYQYFRPAQDPIAQADLLIRELRAQGGLESGDLAPALDIEITDGVAPAELQRRALVWLARVEAALQRKPLIYTSPAFWEDLDPSDAFAQHPLWIAHWDTACPGVPATWSRWRFWQDSDAGTIPGISVPVDTDRFDGTLAELHAFAGRAPAPKSPPPPRARPARPRPKPAPAAPAPPALAKAGFDVLDVMMRGIGGALGRGKKR